MPRRVCQARRAIAPAPDREGHQSEVRFDEARRQIFEGSPRLDISALPEVLSWHTGRFGGKVSFIVDAIEGPVIGVRDVWREVPHEQRSNRLRHTPTPSATVLVFATLAFPAPSQPKPSRATNAIRNLAQLENPATTASRQATNISPILWPRQPQFPSRQPPSQLLRVPQQSFRSSDAGTFPTPFFP